MAQHCAPVLHGRRQEDVAAFHQGGEFRLCGLWQRLVHLLREGHPTEEEEDEEQGAEVEEVRVVHTLMVRGLLLFAALGGLRQVRHAQVELDARVNV